MIQNARPVDRWAILGARYTRLHCPATHSLKPHQELSVNFAPQVRRLHKASRNCGAYESNQVWWLLERRPPLGRARVGGAHHPDSAITPRLAGYPFDGVIAIRAFAPKGSKAAIRITATSHIAADERKTMPGKVLGRSDLIGVRIVVRGARQDGWEFRLTGREINICR
jgi:hypothetical protein